MARRRRFGALRRLPSGRWQASYQTADGVRRTAKSTFATKTDADRWLSSVETDLLRGTWVDAEAGKVSLGVFAREWLATNPAIGPRWGRPASGTCGSISSPYSHWRCET